MRKRSSIFGVLLVMSVCAPVGAADSPITWLPLQPQLTDPDVKQWLEAMQARGQKLINLNVVSALSPKIAKARSTLAFAIRYDSIVPRPYRELTIVRTAQLMGGAYELSQHIPAAMACGYSHDQIVALPQWQSSMLFSDKDRALLAYLDATVRQRADPDDRTLAELERYFNSREIVEITMIAGAYMSTSMLTNALHIMVDDPDMTAVITSGPC